MRARYIELLLSALVSKEVLLVPETIVRRDRILKNTKRLYLLPNPTITFTQKKARVLFEHIRKSVLVLQDKYPRR